MMMMKRIGAATALLLATTGGAAAQEDCHLHRVASFAMSIDESGGVSIPLTVSGHRINFLVDTGGLFSMLSPATADALGLQQIALPGPMIQMLGGKTVNRYVTAPNIELGPVTLPQMQFLILPEGYAARDNGGVLAPEFLSNFDVDFDFANAKLTLYTQDHCEGKVVYWTKGDYAVVPFEFDHTKHIRVPVEIDGKEIWTDLDTGASLSELSLNLAHDKFGIGTSDPGVKDLGEHAYGHTYGYTFKTMTFGGVTVANPYVMLVPDVHYVRLTDGLIGMGVLRQLHMYIAYKEKKIYVTGASAGSDAAPTAAQPSH